MNKIKQLLLSENIDEKLVEILKMIFLEKGIGASPKI